MPLYLSAIVINSPIGLKITMIKSKGFGIFTFKATAIHKVVLMNSNIEKVQISFFHHSALVLVIEITRWQ